MIHPRNPAGGFLGVGQLPRAGHPGKWGAQPIVAACRLAAASLAALAGGAALAAAPGSALPVTIEVDAARDVGSMDPIWAFFGADEPNYATMRDGRRLLAELGALRPGGVWFRTHNLLNTGDGVPALKWGSTNAYTEDAGGRPVYDWTILDRIFDAYRQRGVRPYAEIGFMPEALSIHPEPYQHDWRPGSHYAAIGTGWSYPPKDYHQWAALIHAWVTHCVARYGKAEVARWYWEVWNEPNGSAYWHGSPEDFDRLHDFAIDAVRRALPEARVGGPDVAGSGGAFMRQFLEHCLSGINYATGRIGTPLDFVSFHAKGRPEWVDGHARLGIADELRTIDTGFSLIASFPALRDKPIVIGESDPDGCAACVGPQLAYRPRPQYASYTADCIAREFQLASGRGVNLRGALTWSFEFEDQPFFSGQRVLASEGIDLPILNLYRMLALMGGRRVATASSGELPLAAILAHGVRAEPDIGALAAFQAGRLAVLVWHYHDDDLPGADGDVHLEISGLPQEFDAANLVHYRIDERHSNAYAAWKRMGSPVAPSSAQYASLQAAGRLAVLPEAPDTVRLSEGRAAVRFALPRQAVSLLVFSFDHASTAEVSPTPQARGGRGP